MASKLSHPAQDYLDYLEKLQKLSSTVFTKVHAIFLNNEASTFYTEEWHMKYFSGLEPVGSQESGAECEASVGVLGVVVGEYLRWIHWVFLVAQNNT